MVSLCMEDLEPRKVIGQQGNEDMANTDMRNRAGIGWSRLDSLVMKLQQSRSSESLLCTVEQRHRVIA